MWWCVVVSSGLDGLQRTVCWLAGLAGVDYKAGWWCRYLG